MRSHGNGKQKMYVYYANTSTLKCLVLPQTMLYAAAC